MRFLHVAIGPGRRPDYCRLAISHGSVPNDGKPSTIREKSMTIRPRISSSTFASICISGALAATAATAAWAQPSAQEPVQVSGADLQAWLSNGFVYAAEDHSIGSVFFVMGAANDRRLFYYINEHSATSAFKGTQRVVGDTLCATWPFNARGEQCREWYRVGENKYEQREKGSRTKSSTLYIVRGRTP